jgi:hypothetical protein
VAAQIADLIERPRAELTTRPELRELSSRYHAAEDVAIVESQPPFTMRKP